MGEKTMVPEKIFDQIAENIDAVIAQEPLIGQPLWEKLIQLHPADIAEFLSNLDLEHVRKIFLNFGKELQLEVFQNLSASLKTFCLSCLNDHDREHILNGSPLDELTDLFDNLS